MTDIGRLASNVTEHAVYQPLTDAAADDEPMLAGYAGHLAERYCEQRGLTLHKIISHRVVMPAAIDGERLVFTAPDGTELPNTPVLLVELRAY